MNNYEDNDSCMHPDTPILMYFGLVKTLKNIQRGDIIMGDDYQPRVVKDIMIKTCQMYQITPEEGDIFYLSANHMITLYNSISDRIIDIPVDDFINKDAEYKKRYKLYSIPVEYNKVDTKNDPYLIGMILGNKNNAKIENIIKEYLFKRLESLTCLINEQNIKQLSLSNMDNDEIHQLINVQYIPNEYIFNNRFNRIRFLKGFIDSNTTINITDKVDKCITPKSIGTPKIGTPKNMGTPKSTHVSRSMTPRPRSGTLVDNRTRSKSQEKPKPILKKSQSTFYPIIKSNNKSNSKLNNKNDKFNVR